MKWAPWFFGPAFIPWQTFPSPLYPKRHRQRRLPFKAWQYERCGHFFLSLSHSIIAETHVKKINMNNNNRKSWKEIFTFYKQISPPGSMITRTDLLELAVFGHSTFLFNTGLVFHHHTFGTDSTCQFTGFCIGRISHGKKFLHLKTLVFIAYPYHVWDCKYVDASVNILVISEIW